MREPGVAQPRSAGDTTPISIASTGLPGHDLGDAPYLSYPELSELDPLVGRAEHERRLAEAAEAVTEPIELLVHLAFREGRTLYGSCAVSPAGGQGSRSVLDHVRRELDLIATRLRDRRRVSRLLVTGSPALYSPRELLSFLAHLVSRFPPLAFAELGVAIDPRVATDPHLDAFAGFGFDRAWLGVEDLSSSPADVGLMARGLARARRAGFTSLGIDLVCGLPEHADESVATVVATAIDLGFDRITLRPARRELDLGRLVATAHERLVAAAYQPIGLDTFVRATDLLAAARAAGTLRRSIGGYTATYATDVIGLGAGASSDVAGASFQNATRLDDYEAALVDWRLPIARGLVRDRDDEIRRRVLHDLLCHGRVDAEEIAAALGIELADYFADELARLAPYAKEGRVRLSPQGVEVLPAGRLAARELAECFDRRRREPVTRDRTLLFSRRK